MDFFKFEIAIIVSTGEPRGYDRIHEAEIQLKTIHDAITWLRIGPPRVRMVVQSIKQPISHTSGKPYIIEPTLSLKSRPTAPLSECTIIAEDTNL